MRQEIKRGEGWKELRIESDDKELFIKGDEYLTFQDIVDQAVEHFKETDLSKLKITPEHIHMRCLTYDMHDESDYDDYFVVTRND